MQKILISAKVNLSKINLLYKKENIHMSEHNCSCGCGCDGHEQPEALTDEMTVVLTLDDDEELECVVLTIFEANNQEYIALLPIADEQSEEEEDSDVYIYRYQENEGAEPTLDNIESDEEYEIAADAFDEWLDMQDFEEMADEE